MFEKKVLNGYGLKRVHFTKLRLCFGKSNKVYVHRHYPFDGINYFMYSLGDFPFNFMLHCGKISTYKFKLGLYFQGTEQNPYKSFKVVWGRFFIGGDAPKSLQKYGAKRFKKEHDEYFKPMKVGY